MEVRNSNKRRKTEKSEKDTKMKKNEKSLNIMIQEIYSAVTNEPKSTKTNNKLTLNSLVKKDGHFHTTNKKTFKFNETKNDKFPLKFLAKIPRVCMVMKYNTKKEDYENMILENILSNKNCHLVSIFKDHMLFDCNEEFFKRLYSSTECNDRLPKIANYYKNYLTFFCKPTFSNFSLNTIIQDYGDQKAEQYYKNNYGFSKKKKQEKSDENIKTIFNTTVKNNIEKHSLTISNITKEKEFSNANTQRSLTNHLLKNFSFKQSLINLKSQNQNPLVKNKVIKNSNCQNSMVLNINNKSLNLMKSGLITSRSIENSIAGIISQLNNPSNECFTQTLKTIPNNLSKESKTNTIGENKEKPMILNTDSNVEKKRKKPVKSIDIPQLSGVKNKNYHKLVFKLSSDLLSPSTPGRKIDFNFKNKNINIKNHHGVNSNVNDPKPNIFFSSNKTPPLNIFKTVDANSSKINKQRPEDSLKSPQAKKNHKTENFKYFNNEDVKITLALNVNHPSHDKLSRNGKPSFLLNANQNDIKSNNLLLNPLYATTNSASLANLMTGCNNLFSTGNMPINVNNLNININNNIRIEKLSSGTKKRMPSIDNLKFSNGLKDKPSSLNTNFMTKSGHVKSISTILKTNSNLNNNKTSENKLKLTSPKNKLHKPSTIPPLQKNNTNSYLHSPDKSNLNSLYSTIKTEPSNPTSAKTASKIISAFPNPKTSLFSKNKTPTATKKVYKL